MKNNYLTFLTFIVLTFFALILTCDLNAQVTANSGVVYVSPKPGSYYNHQATNIIIKFINQITPTNISDFISVKTSSTNINFTATLTENGKTVIINPINILPSDLKITVSLINDLLLTNNQIVKPFSFNFYTTKNISSQFVNNELSISNPSTLVQANTQAKTQQTHTISSTKLIAVDINNQIPLTVITNKQSRQAYYFITTIAYNNLPNRCMILDNKGRVVYERFTKGYNLDFKMLNDTLFSYYDWNDNAYYVLSTQFNVVDTVKAKNGYVTDNHELQIDKKTGHYFLLVQEHVTVDMTASVLGGFPNANVLGLIIQELDANKNVVFEWHTLDYLPITADVGVNLAAQNIDYIHCNSIDLDTDSTLLLSSRHLNEIERIDRRNGNLIWRFGKAKRGSQFTFLNDTAGFSYQHDPRRLPNGNILMFDNGNFRSGFNTGNRYSRAVEYKLDEEKLTATMVWQYRDSVGIVSDFMGSAQRMPNGNTLIGWGGTAPTFTEVDSNNHKVFEVSMANPFSYRAFKYENIDDIISANQNRINTIPDTLDFCNVDKSQTLSNINSIYMPYIPISISKNLVTVTNPLATNILVATENNANFYAYYPSFLDFNYTYLNQNDTLVCISSGLLTLAVHDDCKNLKFKWSTNDTTPSIKVDPSIGSKQYWVEMRNGTYYKKDSVNINVSGVANFEVLGQQLLTSPYQLLTYSVPFDPAFSYTWNVKNGNIISGYNSNALTIQWGNKDSNFLQSIITNTNGCFNQTNDTILFKKSTGINQLSSSGNLSVYPNPVKDILTINSKKDVTYELFDIEGKLILSSTSAQKSCQINMVDLATGYYLLNVISSESIERIKVVKN